MPVRTRPGLAFGAAVVVLALAFFGACCVRSVEPLGLDQGLFACFARWVPRGWLPYRDIYDSKPPLFLYSWVLSAIVPGDTVQSVWRLEAGWLLAIMALAYRLARRVWDRATGLSAAALIWVALWTPGWGGYWSRAQADELSALPVLAAAWLAWAAIDRPRLAFWAGVLTGISGLYKIPTMAVAGAWPLTWWWIGPWRSSLKRTALMALGLIVPWAVTAGWFAIHGAFGSFFEGVFVYHRYNAAYISPPWSQVLRTFCVEMATHAPLLVLLAAAGIARAWKKREARWLLPWTVLTLLAVILQRQLAGYQYLLAMPALAIAGSFGAVELVRMRRGVAAIGLVAAAVLAVCAGTQWWSAYGIDAMHLRGRLSREQYLQRLQPGAFSSATEEQAAAYLRAHSAATDGLLIWGLSPGIYALADRHPVTRYPFHKILMTDAPLSRMIPGLEQRRAELMRGLEKDPPLYVFLGRGDRNGFEPQDSVTSMMQFPALRDLLRDKYHPETEIGRFLVLRRNP